MPRVHAPNQLLKRLACLGAVWSGLACAAGVGTAEVAADASGVPLLTRFNAEHYDVMPQHVGVAADASGRVFVANVEGLLVYSAGRFESIQTPHENSLRSIALTRDGAVLAGGYDQFGLYTESADGSWSYTDLDERFRDVAGAHPIGQVWLVQELPDGYYAQGDHRLFRIGHDGSAGSWPNPGPALTALRVGDELWGRYEGIGLMRFDGNGFARVPGGEEFIRYGVQSSAPHPAGTVFTSRMHGIYLATGKTAGLKHVDTPYDAWLREVQAYSITALDDGDFAIATLSGEVAIVDTRFALKKRYRVSNYPITDITQSADGGLWCATEGDLVRLEWPSPWTFVGEEDGLFGALNDAEWFEGSRWVATSLGLFRSRVGDDGRARFAREPWAADEVWDLQRVGGDLLVGERNSVMRLRAGVPSKVTDSSGVFELQVSTFVHERVLALEDSAIVELERRPDWHVVKRHELGEISISTLVELDGEHWLLGNWRGYPVLAERVADANGVHLQLTPLGAQAGFATAADVGSSVWLLDGKVYAVIGHDLYERRGERFAAVPDHPLAILAGSRVNELEFRRGNGQEYAFTSRAVWKMQDGRWEPLRVESRRALGLSELSIAEDGRLTVVAWGGLLTFDPNLGARVDSALHLRMHRATLTDAAHQTRLLDRRGIATLDLPPLDALRFEYGIDGHDAAVEFRTRLADGGGGGEWSEWTAIGEREFTRLAPGHYQLSVEARTRGGRASSDALRFAFQVQPRWYQTRAAAWAAAAAALALGSLLAWFWGRHRSRKLRERNLELEREVAAHTRELEVANQRLSRLAVQDGLTGITNRRGFEQFFARSWNRLAEQRRSLAVLMVDVDFFKQYNDQHGHLLGDEMLRGIARQLEQHVQEPEELLARFGGEEFVVVLCGVEIEEAAMRAHAIRARCEEFGKERGITVSVGVAACWPRGGLRPAQLIEEADAALYRAKKLGRNRVERGRAI
ncbi:MAG: diguanylate cyclase [Xanthomonadales bacterium]|nr:diguanylate cyclase [Xanthomonadales bacterium]